MKRFINLVFFFMVFLAGGCDKAPSSGTMEEKVLLNQEGYPDECKKYVLVIGKGEKISVKDNKGNEVLSGIIPKAGYWPFSGDSAAVIDLSNIRKVGEYSIIIDGERLPQKFIVRNGGYSKIVASAIRAFYLNRSGMTIDSSYAGQWARLSGHPDTTVIIHESAASKERLEGTVISSPGGWYDAGDYNKYIVNSGITTFTLLQALDDFTEYYQQLDCNIPESGNKLPDLLDETLYNLRWMLTMQDPNDGGVYHKLTTKTFEGFVMPHEATNQRFVVQKGTAATLDFAAVCAKASRVLEPWKEYLPGLIDSCKNQAVYAWQWAVKNPNVTYHQPKDISTGAYDDENLMDEWYWAACELYLTQKDEPYLATLIDNYQEQSVPSWGNVGTLGTISLLTSNQSFPDKLDDLNMEQEFVELVDQLIERWKKSPFMVSVDHFEWGSNSTVANEGMLKLIAFKIKGKTEYIESAMSDLDYLLGRNATGYCFVTGFGQKSVMNIHHRPSVADEIEVPIPGFLVGGPNTVTFDDCPLAERSKFPAKSYVDKVCSYSTNEIAINWNAPLVYLSGGLSTIYEK
jgi:endoglucanase